LAPDVTLVQTIGRAATGRHDAKLREMVHADLWEYASIESQLAGFDACFFCLGVSAPGMTEADYTRITYDLTLAAARALARVSPQMTFVYVSGAGTDSTERGRMMWARVKGRTENAPRRLMPRLIVTTEQLGQAMLAVARRGWPTPVLEARDIF